MSKYNFELYLSLNTSTGLIISKIKKGSVILEFGCAEGRMTRYLKEELGCSVYICEYDKESYEVAKQFALGGVCGDLCSWEWREKFRDIRFDAILFADVLEHIAEPVAALRKAGELLSEDGRIIISLPNITHNDIILKAVREHFDYTSTGLLDDTHIHFWGKENIREFAESAGLIIKEFQGTYEDTCFTEQSIGTTHDVPGYVLNYLKERECGEVYQFVVSLGVNKEGPDARHALFSPKRPATVSMLYYDRGEGYSPFDSLAFHALKGEEGRYVAEIETDNTEKLVHLRFDPVDFQPCIVTKIEAYQGENKLKPQYSECLEQEEGVLMYGDDPQIIFDTAPNSGSVRIRAEFMIMGEEFLSYLFETTKKIKRSV